MNTPFLIGSTVDHTPAFSKRTLFISGKQAIEDIEKQAKEHNVQHISFSSTGIIPNKEIEYFLAKGYWITLEYMSSLHSTVMKSLGDAILKHRLFVPMINVAIPHIENVGPNFTVKIGDTGFNKTNRGAWSMHYTEITDSNRFTEWKEYPGYTETDTTEELIEQLIVEDTREEINNNNLGVDNESKSALKPEYTDNINEVDVSNLTTLEAIAKAYIK